MRVIARFPRLDAAGPAGAPRAPVPGDAVDAIVSPPSPAGSERSEPIPARFDPRPEAASPPSEEVVVVAASSERASVPSRGEAGRRRAGPPFPIVSTLILATVAGACWAAVWWQERSRESVAVIDGREPVERIADNGAIDPAAGSVPR